MLSILRTIIIVVIGIACSVCPDFVEAEDRDFPEWLGGKPDLEIRADRCGVYEWFLAEADSQTEGTARKDELTSKRLINIANKLVDHHLTSPTDSYGAEIRFLVIGQEQGPHHFRFHISDTELARAINESCEQ